jgi:CheY-like chemotaxis protein
MRILIVDDNEDMIFMVSGFLHQIFGKNIDINGFSSMPSALAAITTQEHYDLIITDFRMPRGREGLAVVRAARRYSPQSKIIVMSSDMTGSDKENCDTVILVKFFNFPEFWEALEKCGLPLPESPPVAA